MKEREGFVELENPELDKMSLDEMVDILAKAHANGEKVYIQRRHGRLFSDMTRDEIYQQTYGRTYEEIERFKDILDGDDDTLDV